MIEKTQHYKNKSGNDLIDEWIENDEPIEVRAKIIGNLQKYSRRYGKKDKCIEEAKKIANYANRLMEYEESLVRLKEVKQLNDGSDFYTGSA